ncbi:MAG: hypothetical protein JJD92_00370 [Frankiaceae bacterium]|nr:hypothetical protein [Frankiaceae bacterium]
MQSRLALVPAIALVALVSPMANAATKPAKVAPSCNTITDPAGDTFAVRSQDQQGAYGPQEDGLDVTSGDLASDGKVVTAVVRIAKLSRSIALSPTGMSAGIEFTIGGSDTIVRLQAVLVTGQADRFEVTSIAADAVPNTPSTYVGAATGVVDLPKNEVRISAPVALLAPFGPVTKGTKLFPGDAQSATTGRATPVSTTTPGAPASTRGAFADVAIGGKPVVVGAPSCVVPGK